MVERSLSQHTQSEPPSPPPDGNPLPKSDEVRLTPQEWEEICDCTHAFFDALKYLKETGQGIEVLESVQKRLGRRVHKTSNRLAGVSQSFEERSKDDDGILPAE